MLLTALLGALEALSLFVLRSRQKKAAAERAKATMHALLNRALDAK